MVSKRVLVSLTSALVAAGCLIGLSGAVAKANKPHHYSTSVRFDGFNGHLFGTNRGSTSSRGALQGYDYFGHLQSNKAKCYKAGRRIDLVFVREGRDKQIGFDLSDSNGGWSVFDRNTSPPAGTYLARLKPKTVGGDICKGDTATINVVRP